MSRPTVIALREFYASAIGRMVRRQLYHAMQYHWPELNGDLVCAPGYATPILRPFLRQEEQASLFPVMPATQGAMSWPAYETNRTILSLTEQLPFADHSFNRVLLLHELEHTDSQEHLMQECWRILTPGGRLLVMVPSRAGSWSRRETNPFAAGRPYTRAQLRAVICKQFTHIETSHHLFTPPYMPRGMLQLSDRIEKLCTTLPLIPGGIIAMQAEKQLYAGLGEKVSRKGLAYVPVARPALSRDL